MKKVLLIVTLLVFGVLGFAGLGNAHGTQAGTVVSNGGDTGTAGTVDTAGDTIVTYTNGPANGISPTAVTVIVSTGYAIANLPTPNDQTVLAGATAYFAYTICNIANSTDTFTLAAASVPVTGQQEWLPIIYADDGAGGGTANDGVHQNGETNTVTNTSQFFTNTSYYFFVAVPVPSTAVDGSSTTVRLTVKDKNGDGTEDNWPAAGDDTRTDDTITICSVAVLTITKSTDVASARPGELVEYTIVVTNNGTGAASNVVVKDKIPANATFNADSYAAGYGVQLDGVNKTNANDGDEADYNVTTADAITVNIGTINASSSKTVKFKVQIN
ncbi:MAG: hypothetical protein AB1349_00535 [Elusimicrobiota bacterium]